MPLFGFGVLLAVWAAICIGRVAWLAARKGWAAEVWGELPMMLVLGAVIAWVLPGMSDGEGLPIRGYGVMVFCGVVAGVALAVYRAKREGYDPELIYALALWMCVAGILGARLFYVIEYWNAQFHKETLAATVLAVVKYTEGGLIVYGALVGAVGAAIVFFVKYKLPPLKFADIVIPSLLLGLALGRIGCFLNGCCYGGQCNLPWAVTFPLGSPPYLNQASHGQLVLHGIHFDADPAAPAVVRTVDADSPAAAAGLQAGDMLTAITIDIPGLKPLKYDHASVPQAGEVLSVAEAESALSEIELGGTVATFRGYDAARQNIARTWKLSASQPVPARSLPVHPTQLYSAIGALLITLLLLAWYPFRRHDGELLALAITIYPIIRILEEVIRNDEPLIGRTGMTVSQNISVLLLAAAVALWIFILRGPKLEFTATPAKPYGKINTA
jgi:phosphatidylglycerol:prolipoprotein diacylglycerol transferase